MSEFVFDTSDDKFELDVIERSRLGPVVVDFWAEWCAPCRMIAPLLEQLAEEFDSRVTVVKANTDHCQAAAGQFGVSGIPALFGVVGGEVVDGLQGAVDESTLRSFFVKLVAAGALAEARQIEESDTTSALEIYRKLTDEFPEIVEAKIGLGRVSLAQGDRATAQQVIEELESRGFMEPEAEQLRSRLSLSADDTGGDLTQMIADSDADPDDLELGLQLARALAAAGEHESALQRSLSIIERQKTGPGESARELMVDIFRALPEDSQLTRDYRRKLTMLLY